MRDRTRWGPIPVRLLSAVGTCSWALASAACSGDNKGTRDTGTLPDGSTVMDSGASPEGRGGAEGTIADSQSGSPGANSISEGGTVADAGNGGGSGSADGRDAGGTATMLIPDDLAGLVYRYTITPNAAPVMLSSISFPGANSVALRSTGELFIDPYQGASVGRFLSPLTAQPTAHGTISGVLLGEQMTFVDDELWITNPGVSNVLRLVFYSDGNASGAGTVDNIPNTSGILWDPAARIVYVTEGFATGVTIHHYRVANDHTLTRLANITGNGLDSPDGMVITPWGELLVCDFNANMLSRFSIDAQGNATPNGTITDSSLAHPIAVAFAPWGDLYVGNQTGCSVSRFTFDGSRNAVPQGTPFTVPSGRRCDWMTILQ